MLVIIIQLQLKKMKGGRSRRNPVIIETVSSRHTENLGTTNSFN